MSVTPNEVQNITDSAPLATSAAGLDILGGTAGNQAPNLPAQPIPMRPAGQDDSSGPDGFSQKFGTELSGALSDPRGAAALNQPGGFAKMVLASSTKAMTAGSFAEKLSTALGNIGSDASHASDNLLPGQGALKGALNTLSAGAQREAQQKQQQFENQRKMNAEQMEEQKTKAVIAESNARMVHSEALTHQISEQAINESITNGKIAVEKFKTAPQPAPVLQDEVTSAQMQTMIAQKKIDPTTSTAYPTGRKQVGEDASGQPRYATTYTVIGIPHEVTVSAEDAPFLSKYSGIDVKPGQVLPGAQYNNLYQSASDNQAATAARNKTLEESKIGDADRSLKLEVVNFGPEWTNALAAAKNDPFKALQALQSNPAIRAKYPHLAEDVAQAYGGAKEFETMRHNRMEEQIQRQKELNPNGGAMNNIPQSDGLKVQIAQLRQANPSAAAVLDKFDPLTQGSLMAVAFGDGSVDFDKAFPTRLTKGAPGITSQNAISVLKQINPNFDERQYRATSQAFKDATSGKNAQAIQQYNNFIQHSSEAVDALTETNRQGPRVWNMALNKLENAGYGTDATRVQSALSAVRGEISLLLSGGYKPAEDESKTINTILSDASTPAQLSGALQQYAKMGTVRLDNINENYKRVTNKNLPRIIDQKTLDAAKHLGVDPKTYGTLQSLDSNGTIFGSQTPAGANAPKAQPPAPQTHIFDSKAWAAANPGKDVNAAIAAAKQQGYEVK